jgi:hypothetical protein
MRHPVPEETASACLGKGLDKSKRSAIGIQRSTF